MRRLLIGVATAALALTGLVGCEEPKEIEEDPNSAWIVEPVNDTEDASKVFPLVGRWYPVEEVKRLSNRSLTPREWCKRAPARITVTTESVHVQCAEPIMNDKKHRTSVEAVLARVRTSTQVGELVVEFRVEKDFPIQALRFSKLKGVTGDIHGSPCKVDASRHYQRFPQYEILTRQVLSNKRCAQILEADE